MNKKREVEYFFKNESRLSSMNVFDFYISSYLHAAEWCERFDDQTCLLI